VSAEFLLFLASPVAETFLTTENTEVHSEKYRGNNPTLAFVNA
jgi:hypothetical protein